MSNQEDINCVNPGIDLINPATLPTISSQNFNINAFVAELSGIEALQGEETLYIYEPAFPSIEEVMQADKEILTNASNDARFNGEAVYNFIFTHFRPLDITDTYAGESATITLTGCTYDGDLYTYTIPNSSSSALIKDSSNTEVMLPVYDLYNQQVNFPVTDLYGRYLLVESITGLDATQNIVYFPFKDVKNNILKYPFKGVDGSISTHLPQNNNNKISNVDIVYESLDFAYDKAKDADAFKFVNFLLNLEKENKLGFFYGPLSQQNNIISAYFFAVGIYDLSSVNTHLIDITNKNLKYFLRYYPDRAEYVYKLYKSFEGGGPWTIIEPTNSTDISVIIQNEKERLASYTSLSVPYWTPNESSPISYEKNIINSSPVHTSMLELYSLNNANSDANKSLLHKVSTLENQLSSLSTQFVSLYNLVNVLSTNVAYNSAIIDVMANPLNWGNIWFDKPTGYSRPIDPDPRPGPPFP